MYSGWCYNPIPSAFNRSSRRSESEKELELLATWPACMSSWVYKMTKRSFRPPSIPRKINSFCCFQMHGLMSCQPGRRMSEMIRAVILGWWWSRDFSDLIEIQYPWSCVHLNSGFFFCSCSGSLFLGIQAHRTTDCTHDKLTGAYQWIPWLPMTPDDLIFDKR